MTNQWCNTDLDTNQTTAPRIQSEQCPSRIFLQMTHLISVVKTIIHEPSDERSLPDWKKNKSLYQYPISLLQIIRDEITLSITADKCENIAYYKQFNAHYVLRECNLHLYS